jgi:hypothetical protein
MSWLPGVTIMRVPSELSALHDLGGDRGRSVGRWRTTDERLSTCLLTGYLADVLRVPRDLAGRTTCGSSDDRSMVILVVLGVVVGVRRLERALGPALAVLGEDPVVGEH